MPHLLTPRRLQIADCRIALKDGLVPHCHLQTEIPTPHPLKPVRFSPTPVGRLSACFVPNAEERVADYNGPPFPVKTVFRGICARGTNWPCNKISAPAGGTMEKTKEFGKLYLTWVFYPVRMMYKRANHTWGKCMVAPCAFLAGNSWCQGRRARKRRAFP